MRLKYVTISNIQIKDNATTIAEGVKRVPQYKKEKHVGCSRVQNPLEQWLHNSLDTPPISEKQSAAASLVWCSHNASKRSLLVLLAKLSYHRCRCRSPTGTSVDERPSSSSSTRQLSKSATIEMSVPQAAF